VFESFVESVALRMRTLQTALSTKSEWLVEGCGAVKENYLLIEESAVAVCLHS
jgi:hypothetical protein